jgi:anti-anti-sigma regulatory factor
MVMPLVGTLDEERAQDVLQTLLAGATKSGARVVIIDVTGIKKVDERVVGALITAASALRLVGAQAVLTGIRPEIAQALVMLDIDMDHIVVQGTLQGGIAYSVEAVGATEARKLRSTRHA